MKHVTNYKKQVKELNAKYIEKQAYLGKEGFTKEVFKEYLAELKKLDTELLMKIREEKRIGVFSHFYL